MDKRIDLVGVLLVIGLGIFYYALAERLPSTRIGDQLGPEGFPVYLAVGLTATGFLLLIRQIRKWRRTPGWLASPEGVADDPEYPASTSRALYLIIITFLYLALLLPVGYLLATPAFLAAVTALHGVRRVKMLLAVPVSITLILFVVFVLLARIQLPLGLLEFLNDWIAQFYFLVGQ